MNREVVALISVIGAGLTNIYRFLKFLFLTIIIVSSQQAGATEYTWSVSQVTNLSPSPEVGVGAFSADINDAGEILYSFPNNGLVRQQIFSTVRGQITFPMDWFYAQRPRINNLGDVIFIAQTAAQGQTGNPQIYQLSGTRVDLGPNFLAANNVDHNDLGEVVGLGLGPTTALSGIFSSIRGFLLQDSSSQSIGISNSGTIAFTEITQPLIPVPQIHTNFSINDLDEVVFQTAGGTSILFWDGTDVSTVITSVPFGQVGEPRLNNNREIVFQVVDANGVSQIFLLGPDSRIGVLAPAHKLVEDLFGVTVGAYSEVGRGRIVAFTDHPLHDVAIQVADNRLFASQVFSWLRELNWLTALPASGTVAVGDSADVVLTIDGSLMTSGVFRQDLRIASNDPLTPVVTIPVIVTVDSTLVAAGRGRDLPAPESFVLHQNYPNPLNPTTTIAYDLPRAVNTRLVIYNVHGARVRDLMSVYLANTSFWPLMTSSLKEVPATPVITTMLPLPPSSSASHCALDRPRSTASTLAT